MDVHPFRFRLIRENIARLGVAGIALVCGDACHPPVTPVGYWEGPLATLVRLGYATVDERKVHHITDEGRKVVDDG